MSEVFTITVLSLPPVNLDLSTSSKVSLSALEVYADRLRDILVDFGSLENFASFDEAIYELDFSGMESIEPKTAYYTITVTVTLKDGSTVNFELLLFTYAN